LTQSQAELTIVVLEATSTFVSIVNFCKDFLVPFGVNVSSVLHRIMVMGYIGCLHNVFNANRSSSFPQIKLFVALRAAVVRPVECLVPTLVSEC
jgi:hypothetical protein